MRTSSIKSLVSTLTIVATLMLAVPVAEARPSRGRGDTIVQAVIKLLKRVGRITANGGPSIPQNPNDGGDNGNNPDTGTDTTTGGTNQQ
ncbi:MAG TPA: hypothetical protein VGQ36_03235 [Thermoanaerobaculia bacterium]|jgi:hypothetical protein|nr:hypothetical protein [Thermoanaerobaculia bacterium]